MKRMSDVFELPITATNLIHVANETALEDDKAIIHAINHFDALADALESLTSDIESNNNPRYSYECAIAALAAYRGEK